MANAAKGALAKAARAPTEEIRVIANAASQTAQ